MATEASKEAISKEITQENDFDKKDDNPFIELVNKKIRKTNKKNQRIIALKAQIKEKNSAINDDQARLLASEEGTSSLLKELEDLRSQMLKLIPKGSSSPRVSEPAKKKEKEKKKKETKKEKEAPSKASKAPAEKQPTPAPAQTVSHHEPTPVSAHESPKTTQESTPAPTPAPVTPAIAPVSVPEQKEEAKVEAKKEESPATAPKEKNHKESDKEIEESGEFSSAAEVRAEWKAQKDIYIQKYKQTFGTQQENKYVAVHKGILYGPCDTLQQLKEAQGGDKLPGAFLARVGHEDEQPVPRRQGTRGGFRGGRGRGGGSFRNGRGRGGRGRGNGNFEDRT